MPSFNFIAPYYDFLAGLVYGSNLNKAKTFFINQISANADVLLMGGGTGAALNDMLSIKPNMRIDFIEPSSAMLAIARQKLDKRFIENVRFIHGNHLSIPSGKKYDVITSFFVIDCFTQLEAIAFCKAITAPLKPNGIWLFADFYSDKNIFHRWLLWIMYRFFKVVAGISAGHLPDYEAIFNELRFNSVEEQHFIGGLIRSKVYKKRTKENG